MNLHIFYTTAKNGKTFKITFQHNNHIFENMILLWSNDDNENSARIIL